MAKSSKKRTPVAEKKKMANKAKFEQRSWRQGKKGEGQTGKKKEPARGESPTFTRKCNPTKMPPSQIKSDQ